MAWNIEDNERVFYASKLSIANYQQQLYVKYQICKQGNYSVNEYTKEFYHLHTMNNMDEPEFWIVMEYLGRLKQKLQDEIEYAF